MAFCPPGDYPSHDAPLCVQLGIGYYNDSSGAAYAGIRTDDLSRFRSTSGSKTWDVFVWSNTTYYGSSEVAIQQVSIDPALGAQIFIHVPPRPLPPTAITPAPGLTNAPSAFPLVWYSGIDVQRRAWKGLISYDFYYKAWPFGGTEPASYIRWAADFPCTHPDAWGECSTPQSNMPPGNYLWYIVAKLDVSSSVGGRHTVFTTQIPPAYLAVGAP